MLDDAKLYVGKVYELTDYDIECLTKYHNEGDTESLIDFCKAIAWAVSSNIWSDAEMYLREVGKERFLSSCSNCRKNLCKPEYALDVCGARNLKWKPIKKEK